MRNPWLLAWWKVRSEKTYTCKGGGEHIIEAGWIIIAAALLWVLLGVYVYLGSKAEGMLLKNNGNTRKQREKGGRSNL